VHSASSHPEFYTINEPGRAPAQRNKMKNSRVCPKCQNDEIVRIPGETRAFGAGNNILVGSTIFSAAKVTRYLCASCGFSEEWVESADDIASIKKKYAT
jgi:predicted nucleic-acid-binding Zn-ribbon protein